ncbi:MAG TPA: aspartate/glutamate racemase family protein [Anaerovoracaceae bacterium]|nr:aspartate/glutamate racemase family protein [Anaerovoracaceae bacterium]
MKIKIIDPIVRSDKNSMLPDKESSRSYLKKFLRADTEIDFVSIEHGFESVESVLHVAFNAPEVVLKAKQVREEGYDGVFVNCFDDPGVYGCREIIDIPVFGGYVPSVITAASLGGSVGIITTDSNGLYTEAKKAKDNGFEDIIRTIRSVDLPVLELGRRDTLLDRLTEICEDSVSKESIRIFVLGCTGMSYIAEELRERLKAKGCSAAVIEPLATGTRYLEYIIGSGFTNSMNYRIGLDSLKWNY